jgi:hypothetical protein
VSASRYETPVPNGRRNRYGVAAVLGIVATGIVVLVWLGVPAPSDIYTRSEAKAARVESVKEHETLHERISSTRRESDAALKDVIGELRTERTETQRKLEAIDVKLWELVKKSRQE